MVQDETTCDEYPAKSIRLLQGVAAAEGLYLIALFVWHYRPASVLPAIAVAAGFPLLCLAGTCLSLRSRYSRIACPTEELLIGVQAGWLTYLILHQIPGDLGFGILMILVGVVFQAGFFLVMGLFYIGMKLGIR